MRWYDQYIREVRRVQCPLQKLNDIVAGSARPKPEEVPYYVAIAINSVHSYLEHLRSENPDSLEISGRLSAAKIGVSPEVAHIISKLRQRFVEWGVSADQEKDLQVSFLHAIHTITFRDDGFRRYQVSDGLACELDETNFGDIQCSDFHLPYSSIYIDIPKSLGQVICKETGNTRTPTGIFLAEEPANLLEAIDTGSLVSGRTLMVLATSYDNDPQKEYTANVIVQLSEEETLSQKLDHLPTLSTLQRVLIWAIKVVLYATWPDAIKSQEWLDPRAAKLWREASSASSKSRRKKLLKKFEEHHATDQVTLLGKNIVVDRTVPAYRAQTESEGRKLEVRIRVSGHMKRQACGDKRSERKIVWIRPYWKGPEDGPVKFSGHTLVARKRHSSRSSTRT